MKRWNVAKSILLGCEESGIGRQAFRKLGFDAWSNDLLPARDGSPFHLQMDVRDAILSRSWDAIILFPPCTHTCVSGNGTWAGTQERIDAAIFTASLFTLASKHCKFVALEQPRTMVGQYLGPPTQRVQLWWFGDGETKETWFWLRGFEPLVADNLVEGRKTKVFFESPGIVNGLTRAQRRSTLRPGLARAMASQWGAQL